jgi:Concanavalin A-like lectin/glucanases superfamily
MFKSMKNHSVVFGAVLFLLAFVLAPTSATADTCVFPPAGMTNWWPTDGNAFDIIGGNDGTLQGNAGFAAGMVAQAFNLDGAGDFVLVPNDPAAAFNFHGSFTIDAWVLLNSAPPQFAPIVSKWNDIGVNHRGYFLAIDTRVLNDGVPRLRFDVSQDGLFVGGHSSIRLSNVVFPLNIWTHVAAVFNGTTHALDVYINGQLHNGPSNISPTVTAPFVTNEPLLIGAGDLGGDQRDFFNGRIDEVELFDRALSAAEILGIFAAGEAGKVIPIAIDIKPGGVRNPINLRSRGKVPVAILSSETFDATTVDVGSVMFAGAPVVTKKNGTFQFSVKDVNHDGLLDLFLHFNTQALNLNHSSTQATLTGTTLNGRCIAGTDSVKIVPGSH